MNTNWAAIITTVLTVIVGLACAVLALTLAKGNEAATGVLWSTAGAALGSFLRQPQSLGKKE